MPLSVRSARRLSRVLHVVVELHSNVTSGLPSADALTATITGATHVSEPVVKQYQLEVSRLIERMRPAALGAAGEMFPSARAVQSDAWRVRSVKVYRMPDVCNDSLQWLDID